MPNPSEQAQKLKRYSLVPDENALAPDPNGDWVKFAHLEPLVAAAQAVMQGLDAYCDYPEHQNPYEGEDCPHEFIGLEKCEALRKALESL
jgi:hypothetical protein